MSTVTFAVMPAALRLLLVNSLKRIGSGDPIQVAVNAAAQDYGAPSSAGSGPSVVDLWWTLYADKGRLALRLQYLYVQREMLTDLERRLFEWTTYSEAGITEADGDVFKALTAMRKQADDDIAVLEKQIGAGRGVSVGLMATDRIGIVPGPFGADPNDPIYRGDPVRRPFTDS